MEDTYREPEARKHGPSDRFREYEVVVKDDATNVYRGFGMNLDRVIKDEQAWYSERFAGWEDGQSAEKLAEFVGNEPDRVVWDGTRVLCVLRPMVGSLDVLLPETGSPAGEEELPDDPDDDNDPSDPASMADLIWDATDRAIARYHEATRWAKVARRIDTGKHSNPWSVLAGNQECDAEKDLIRTILCHDPDFHEADVDRCVHRKWRPRGVRHLGRIYLAICNPDQDDEAESDYWIMRLVEVDPARITDLDGPQRASVEALAVQSARVIEVEQPPEETTP